MRPRIATNALHTLGGIFLFFVVILASCSDDEPSLDDLISELSLQTAPAVIHPTDNQASPQKIELGKLLFWDPILSGEKNIACATCHHPSLGCGDGIDLSIGPGGTGLGVNRVLDPGKPSTLNLRNSISLINVGYVGLDENLQLDVTMAPLNWHILKRSMELQVFGPLAGVPLMRGTGVYDGTSVGDTLVKRIKAIEEYVTRFDQVFDGSNGSGVTKDNIGKALATFERSIVSTNSAYDKYVNGQTSAMTQQQKRGLMLFFDKAKCSTCHSGSMFSDFALHRLGVKHNNKLSNLDKGNGNQYLFRTPSLRNATLTAPYMHNGTIATLKEVVEFYNKGLSENPEINSNDIEIEPLGLTGGEVDDLVAFLEALTDNSFDKVIPTSVPSGLTVGGN